VKGSFSGACTQLPARFDDDFYHLSWTSTMLRESPQYFEIDRHERARTGHELRPHLTTMHSSPFLEDIMFVGWKQ
jgi:hypothetical protein